MYVLTDLLLLSSLSAIEDPRSKLSSFSLRAYSSYYITLANHLGRFRPVVYVFRDVPYRSQDVAGSVLVAARGLITSSVVLRLQHIYFHSILRQNDRS